MFIAYPRSLTARSLRSAHVVLYICLSLQVFFWTATGRESIGESHTMTLLRFMIDVLLGDTYWTIALNVQLSAAWGVHYWSNHSAPAFVTSLHFELTVLIVVCALTALIARICAAEIRSTYDLEIEREIRDRFLTATMDGGITVRRTGNRDFRIAALDKRACELFHCSDSAIGKSLERFVDEPSGLAELAVNALHSQSGPALLRQMEFVNLVGQTISANVYAVAYADSVALAFKTIDNSSAADGYSSFTPDPACALDGHVANMAAFAPVAVGQLACPPEGSEVAEIHSRCGVNFLDFGEMEKDICGSEAPTFKSDQVSSFQLVCGGVVTKPYSDHKHEVFKQEVSKITSSVDVLRVATESGSTCSL